MNFEKPADTTSSTVRRNGGLFATNEQTNGEYRRPVQLRANGAAPERRATTVRSSVLLQKRQRKARPFGPDFSVDSSGWS